MFLEASGGVEMRRMQKKQIECAAADLSPAYTKAVREDLPNSVLICDRFHIMQMLHRTITDCRRTIYRNLPDETARRAIKGSRFVLLKRRSGLDPAQREPERLEKALKLNSYYTRV